MEERYSRFIRFGNGNNVNNEMIGEGNDGSKPKSINEVFSANDGIVTPKLGPKKSSARPIIVVIDDDYATLDLLKIYLQRDYECATFSNPKEAIFYLNSNIPDAIYIDCYMTIISTKRILDIIRSYKELVDVPIFYLVNEEEQNSIKNKLYNNVLGYVTRPIARGKLQETLDIAKNINDEKNGNSEPDVKAESNGKADSDVKAESSDVDNLGVKNAQLPKSEEKAEGIQEEVFTEFGVFE